MCRQVVEENGEYVCADTGEVIGTVMEDTPHFTHNNPTNYSSPPLHRCFCEELAKHGQITRAARACGVTSMQRAMELAKVCGWRQKRTWHRNSPNKFLAAVLLTACRSKGCKTMIAEATGVSLPTVSRLQPLSSEMPANRVEIIELPVVDSPDNKRRVAAAILAICNYHVFVAAENGKLTASFIPTEEAVSLAKEHEGEVYETEEIGDYLRHLKEASRT